MGSGGLGVQTLCGVYLGPVDAGGGVGRGKQAEGCGDAFLGLLRAGFLDVGALRLRLALVSPVWDSRTLCRVSLNTSVALEIGLG